MRRVPSLLLLFAASAAAQTPTIEESLSLKQVSSPRGQPRGFYVAYVVRETNWEENAFETEIWLANAATNDTFQLTKAKKSSSNPRWSPDGKWLGFLSDRPAPAAGKGDGRNQIYIIPPSGGEARLLTRSETGVSNFDWSPDGKSIAFTAADPEDKPAKERKEKYGEFEIVQGDYTHTHLWLLPVNPGAGAAAAPARVTEGKQLHVGGFTWSPDSQRIAFSAQRDPDPGSSHTADIYVLTVGDKSVQRIVDTPGPDGNPRWSPDGKQIAYVTSNAREFYYYSNDMIATVPAAGGGPRVYAEAMDEDVSLIGWGPQGIYFSALARTASHLFLLDTATGKARRITFGGDGVYSALDPSPGYVFWSCVYAAPNRYPEIALLIAGRPDPEPFLVTDMTGQIARWKLAQREVIEWKSGDGTPIEGVLYKPADFEPKKKYPLLVVIHGGPTAADRPSIAGDQYYPLEKFVAKGALVLRPNYRGSAGYGEKFRALNVRNLGVGDYADVISGVDHLIGKGWVDGSRVGAMGWSQGGYISAFITTFSDRFKAVSVGAGISNWMTYYVNTDIHPFTRQYLKATPWDDPEIYARTSPMTYIKKAKTPTLIQHGEFDRRVPIPNAYELYQGLQDQGVPVKLVVYKGFGHGINKPRQQRAVMEHNWEWFLEHLWGEKP